LFVSYQTFYEVSTGEDTIFDEDMVKIGGNFYGVIYSIINCWLEIPSCSFVKV